MSGITKEYADNLPLIYRDILASFPEIEPARKAGEGLAYQTLHERLRNWPEGESLYEYVQADRKHSWSLSEIIQACLNMEQGGAVKIKQNIFVCPTSMGEEIITLLTGKKAGEYHVNPFPVPARD